MEFFNHPEILAPAGSYETLLAAVRAGADAVYLGLEQFNARRGAKNFTLLELADAVRYCHTYNVRVYLTLNISLTDKELPSAVDLANKAYLAGVDAFIVADLGLAKILRGQIPEIRLHGSTQLTVHSPSALPILKEMGFSRIVLSREMSKGEIAEFCRIAKEYGIETEVFVHGALCMCMSGQCYLSALLGSRSGNRGLCAAPCRLPFSAQNGTGHDLSLKDLSLISFIDEMYKMGVTSFKIEGRMKRPEYAAAAVAAARNSGEADNATLSDIFSRSGFTDGYYLSALGRNMFGTKDDGVTPSSATLNSVHSIYRTERQKLGVDILFETENGAPKLTLTCGDYTAAAYGPPLEPAKNPPDLGKIKAKLSSLGGTAYYAEKMEINIDETLFIPLSVVTALKTEACDTLTAKRTEINRVSSVSYTPETTDRRHKVPRLAARFCDINQIPADLSALEFIILPASFSDCFGRFSVPVVAELPRAAGDEKLIKTLIKKAKTGGAAAALVGNLSHIELCKGEDLPFMTSFGLNIFNTETCKTYESLGAKAHLLPFEPTANILKSIGGKKPRGIIAYGRLPLMLTRNCPIKNGTDCGHCDKQGVLTDRTGAKFPVRCNAGFSEIFNSVPLYLADKPEITDGFDFSLLFFTTETEAAAESIITAYKEHLAPEFPFTRGLYIRGVE